jgi:hypothetical protein
MDEFKLMDISIGELVFVILLPYLMDMLDNMGDENSAQQARNVGGPASELTS